MSCWNTKITKLENEKIYISSGDRNKSYFGKFWVAKIDGLDPKFTFKRHFVNDKDGALLDNGIFQIYRTCKWAKESEIYFIQVSKGNYKFLKKQEVLSLF